MMDQRTSSTMIVVLLEDRHLEASFGKPGCGRNATDASALVRVSVWQLSGWRERVASHCSARQRRIIPMTMAVFARDLGEDMLSC